MSVRQVLWIGLNAEKWKATLSVAQSQGAIDSLSPTREYSRKPGGEVSTFFGPAQEYLY
jgi:hypothetical protein